MSLARCSLRSCHGSIAELAVLNIFDLVSSLSLSLEFLGIELDFQNGATLTKFLMVAPISGCKVILEIQKCGLCHTQQ